MSDSDVRPVNVLARHRQADMWRTVMPTGDLWPASPLRGIVDPLPHVALTSHAVPGDPSYGQMQSWLVPSGHPQGTAPVGRTVQTSVTTEGVDPRWEAIGDLPHALTHGLDDIAVASLIFMRLSGPSGAQECMRLLSGRRNWFDHPAIHSPSHFISSNVEAWRLTQIEVRAIQGSPATRVDGRDPRPSTYSRVHLCDVPRPSTTTTASTRPLDHVPAAAFAQGPALAPRPANVPAAVPAPAAVGPSWPVPPPGTQYVGQGGPPLAPWPAHVPAAVPAPATVTHRPPSSTDVRGSHGGGGDVNPAARTGRPTRPSPNAQCVPPPPPGPPPGYVHPPAQAAPAAASVQPNASHSVLNAYDAWAPRAVGAWTTGPSPVPAVIATHVQVHEQILVRGVDGHIAVVDTWAQPDCSALVHIPAAVAQTAVARLGDFGLTLSRARAPPPPGPPPYLTAPSPVDPWMAQQREVDAARHQQMIALEAHRQALPPNPASPVVVTTVVVPPSPVEIQLALEGGRWV